MRWLGGREDEVYGMCMSMLYSWLIGLCTIVGTCEDSFVVYKLISTSITRHLCWVVKSIFAEHALSSDDLRIFLHICLSW
jgi:hypothetical protein